ncbi:hypothetical protein ACLOJK_018318 [Asimina triloba]
MGDAAFPHSITSAAFTDVNTDFDLVEDLLGGGCWLETADCSDLFQHCTPPAANVLSSSYLLPSFDINNSCWNPDMPQIVDQYGGRGSVILDGPAFVETQTDQNIFQSQLWRASTSGATRGSGHLESFTDEADRTLEESEVTYLGSEPGRRLWIQPSSEVGLTSSVKERLMQALNYICQSKRHGDVLVQIWVPVTSGGQNVLTTFNQPFSLSSGSQGLAHYRKVSMKYEFPTDSNQAVGLPGRVFIGKLPEWTPDVRYFGIEEYPRINDAQQCDVRGTLALPIFDQGSQACLGVVEVVMTKQKTSYRPELESICNALQHLDMDGQFNLTSSEGLTIPHLKASNDSFQVALPEISKVLKVVCDTHILPLAQTWVLCMQQDKKGSRHSGENYANCISTVDTACFVNDASIQGFHEACSDHHLLRGQGVAGQAFTKNQPCFSANITDFSREEYPLSHYAKMFKLRAAVAIRLRSIYTGNIDYVLEFFLPVDCISSEEQKEMLNSLSVVIRRICQTLRVVTDEELENEITRSVKEEVASRRMLSKPLTNEDTRLSGDHACTSKEPSVEESSQTTLKRAELKGKGTMHPASMPLEFQIQEFHGFSTATHWDPVVPAGKIFSDLKQHHQDSSNANLDHGDSSLRKHSTLNAEKAAEKKRTRTERTISLEVLRQHFAGSLKDAAKSLGVCPTTLKRICRQHGITRWPSRKIKKVGHSLRKLQVVIDSVQGAEGAIQLSSLYANFPQPSPNAFGTSTFSTLQTSMQTSSTIAQPEAILSTCTAPVKSPSSSCSQTSNSSLSCSSGAQQHSHVPNLIVGEDASVIDSHIVTLKKAYSEVELNQLAGEETGPPYRSHSQKSLSDFLSLERQSSLPRRRNAPRDRNFLRLKVIYGEEKLRFKMRASGGYLDLQKEVAKRLNIGDMSSICLKYLDDDADWVLLTCDDDLQECKDIHSSSLARSIKLSVQHVAELTTKSSFGSSGLL